VALKFMTNKLRNTAVVSLFFCTTAANAVSCLPSGPISASHDGQVISNLVIYANGTPAIDLKGHSRVGVANVIIHQKGNANAVRVAGGANNWLSNVEIDSDDAPAAGPSPYRSYQVFCYNSRLFSMTDVTMRNGWGGAWIQSCPGSTLTSIEGDNMRGDHFVLFALTSGAVLSGFVDNEDIGVSRISDNVNAWSSDHIVIDNGVIRGNNQINGAGVQLDLEAHDISVSNVQVDGAANTCFANYGAVFGEGKSYNNRFANVACTGYQPRALPPANGDKYTKANGTAFLGQAPGDTGLFRYVNAVSDGSYPRLYLTQTKSLYGSEPSIGFVTPQAPVYVGKPCGGF
jgi:hypothetical protein